MNDEADKTTDDPRLGIGGNNPPLPKMIYAENETFGQTVSAYLLDEYREMPNTVAELIAEAATMPEKVENDEDAGKVTSLISRMKGAKDRFEKTRLAEGNPYLTATGVVNSFFFGMIDRIARRDKKNKPGVADLLYDRLDDYNQRKLAAEQARLRKEAADRAREAEQTRLREETEQRAAEEARQSAERARKPEKIEDKTAVAEQAETKASEASVEAVIAQGKADEAHIATLKKPADMVRTRFEGGGMNTMQTEAFAVIEDETKLDKEKLWPFIPLEAKEKALRAFAKNTGHTQTMAGATIGKRPKTLVKR